MCQWSLFWKENSSAWRIPTSEPEGLRIIRTGNNSNITKCYLCSILLHFMYVSTSLEGTLSKKPTTVELYSEFRSQRFKLKQDSKFRLQKQPIVQFQRYFLSKAERKTWHWERIKNYFMATFDGLTIPSCLHDLH